MRITSREQAERAYRHQQQHDHDKAFIKPEIDKHGVHVDRSITGVGMDGIEVTPDLLRAADQQLAAAQDALQGHMTAARELHGPLGDGHGPVAATMRSAFLDRASTQAGGLQAALQNYHDELTNVRIAIAETLATYETVETGVADQLNRQSEGQA